VSENLENALSLLRVSHLIHRIAHKLGWNFVELIDVDLRGNLKVRCECGEEYWLDGKPEEK
jgi:hypothetical protein